MRIETYYKFEDLYKRYNGYISTKDLLDEGFSNRQIAGLTEEKFLEKVCHGHYWMLQCGYKKPDDYKCIEVCLSDPRAVIATKSACFYQGLIATEPDVLSIATKRTDRSKINMMFPVERHYFSDSNYHLGLKKVETKFGSYNIYTVERTVYDLARLKDGVIIDISNQLKEGAECYERIMRYAEMFRSKQKEGGRSLERR